MNLEQFDKLAHTDRIALFTALELLWQNGRTAIQTQNAAALAAGCVSGLGKFYAAEKINEIVSICKALADLETTVLADYIHRSSIGIEDPDADKEGICPVCGGELEYGDDEPLDDGGFYEWTCPGCGATGKEGYGKVFDQHFDVYDGEDKPYLAPSNRVKPIVGPVSSLCAVKQSIMNPDNDNALPQADAGRLNVYFPKEDWNLYFWGFTCFSRQDYAKTVPLDAADEIMLGIQCTQGGCLCELAIRWHMLSNKPVPRLEMFDEAWPLFHAPTFVSVLEQLTQMSQDHAPTPDEVSALLIAHGFTDQSDRPLETANG